MGFFETFALSLFDSSMIIALVHSIKKDVKLNAFSICLFTLLTSIGNALIFSYISNDILSHLLCTTITIVALYCYLLINNVKSIVTCTLIYFVTILIILLLQLIGILIYSLLIGNLEYAFFSGLISQTITLILVLILSRVAPFSLLDAFIEERNSAFSVVITAFFALYYGITILWFIDVKNVITFILEIIIIVLLTITINTVILREGFINRIYKEKLSIYDTYFPIIDDMIEELRSKQHDYHNQIQTLLAMKKDDLFSDKDIEDYITEINHNNIWKDLLKLDNKIISAFLYSKIIEMKNKCIPIQLSILDFDMPSTYSSYQLVEMFGILIDNAIEAVGSTHVNGMIELIIYREDNRNIFEVRNTHNYISTSEINEFFTNGYTTKNSGTRGIGLYKLKKMLEAKKGIIDFYYDTDLGQVIAKIHHY